MPNVATAEFKNSREEWRSSGYAVYVDHWEARFKTGESRPFPKWLLWLLIILVPLPLGPWWLTVGAIIVLAVFFLLAASRSSQSR